MSDTSIGKISVKNDFFDKINYQKRTHKFLADYFKQKNISSEPTWQTHN